MAKKQDIFQMLANMQVSTQGTEMGIARRSKAFYESLDRDPATVSKFKRQKSLVNYKANKKKGSKGDMR